MSDLKIYMNGDLERSKVVALRPDISADPFCIGANNEGGKAVDGLIDEVALFNVALALDVLPR